MQEELVRKRANVDGIPPVRGNLKILLCTIGTSVSFDAQAYLCSLFSNGETSHPGLSYKILYGASQFLPLFSQQMQLLYTNDISALLSFPQTSGQ